MIAMDSECGKEIVHLATPEGMDGVFFDPKRKNIYVSGGRELRHGSAFAYRQDDADHYEVIGKVPTGAGAGTSFWSPQLDRYYVAVPSNDQQEAAILVFGGED